MEEDIVAIFESHDVRPTAVRILVWRTLQRFDFVFALGDLEVALPTVDRSTLFRALTLFVEHEMLQTVNDGSGQQKFCLRRTPHVHLSCTRCGRTICMESQEIPMVPVPEGFEVTHVSYIIQGVCAHCAHRYVDGHPTDCCCHNHS